MRVTPTSLAGVLMIDPDVHRDDRGYFLETWHGPKFAAAGLTATFEQDNHSRSGPMTLRGLHYQVRRPQGKLVRCVRGAIYDVAVDLRPASPTFGRWFGETLSEDNYRMMWIPEGFAHGFLVLSEQADLLYKCTVPYSAPDDRAIRWNDPEINVRWPLPGGAAPVLSTKDAAAPLLQAVDRAELT